MSFNPSRPSPAVPGFNQGFPATSYSEPAHYGFDGRSSAARAHAVGDPAIVAASQQMNEHPHRLARLHGNFPSQNTFPSTLPGSGLAYLGSGNLSASYDESSRYAAGGAYATREFAVTAPSDLNQMLTTLQRTHAADLARIQHLETTCLCLRNDLNLIDSIAREALDRVRRIEQRYAMHADTMGMMRPDYPHQDVFTIPVFYPRSQAAMPAPIIQASGPQASLRGEHTGAVLPPPAYLSPHNLAASTAIDTRIASSHSGPANPSFPVRAFPAPHALPQPQIAVPQRLEKKHLDQDSAAEQATIMRGLLREPSMRHLHQQSSFAPPPVTSSSQAQAAMPAPIIQVSGPQASLRGEHTGAVLPPPVHLGQLGQHGLSAPTAIGTRIASSRSSPENTSFSGSGSPTPTSQIAFSQQLDKEHYSQGAVAEEAVGMLDLLSSQAMRLLRQQSSFAPPPVTSSSQAQAAMPAPIIQVSGPQASLRGEHTGAVLPPPVHLGQHGLSAPTAIGTRIASSHSGLEHPSSAEHTLPAQNTLLRLQPADRPDTGINTAAMLDWMGRSHRPPKRLNTDNANQNTPPLHAGDRRRFQDLPPEVIEAGRVSLEEHQRGTNKRNKKKQRLTFLFLFTKTQ